MPLANRMASEHHARKLARIRSDCHSQPTSNRRSLYELNDAETVKRRIGLLGLVPIDGLPWAALTPSQRSVQ